MKETTTLNLQVDPLVKEQAEKVFSQLGMPLSTAVNLFQSIVCFILVYGANAITRKLSPENSMW